MTAAHLMLALEFARLSEIERCARRLNALLDFDDMTFSDGQTVWAFEDATEINLAVRRMNEALFTPRPELTEPSDGAESSF